MLLICLAVDSLKKAVFADISLKYNPNGYNIHSMSM